MITEINIRSDEFQPFDEHLLVKPEKLDLEIKSDSGIVLGVRRSVLDRPCYGKVIRAGKNKHGIKENDMIVWSKEEGLDVKMLDGEFIFLYAERIIGKKI